MSELVVGIKRFSLTVQFTLLVIYDSDVCVFGEEGAVEGERESGRGGWREEIRGTRDEVNGRGGRGDMRDMAVNAQLTEKSCSIYLKNE